MYLTCLECYIFWLKIAIICDAYCINLTRQCKKHFSINEYNHCERQMYLVSVDHAHDKCTWWVRIMHTKKFKKKALKKAQSVKKSKIVITQLENPIYFLHTLPKIPTIRKYVQKTLSYGENTVITVFVEHRKTLPQPEIDNFWRFLRMYHTHLLLVKFLQLQNRHVGEIRKCGCFDTDPVVLRASA